MASKWRDRTHQLDTSFLHRFEHFVVALQNPLDPHFTSEAKEPLTRLGGHPNPCLASILLPVASPTSW
jgi:hypothetical protein